MYVWLKLQVMESPLCITTNTPAGAKAYLALAGEMLRREELPA